MKIIKKLFVCCITAVFLIFLTPVVNAVQVQKNQAEALNIDKVRESIPKTAEDILGDMDIDSVESMNCGLSAIKDNMYENTKGIIGEAIRTGSAVFAVALITALVKMICPVGGEKYESYISLAGILSIAVITMGNTKSLMGEGTVLMDELYTFSKALLPTLSTAAAAGGAVTSAGAKYATTAFAMDIFLTVGNEAVVPLIYGYAVTAMASVAFENDGLKSAANAIRWTVTTMMTLIVLSFTVYLTVSGTVLGTADEAAAKAAKTAISTTLPIVGSIISDASGAVVGGINTLKNILGVIGILVLLAICAVPLVKLAVNSFVFKIISAFSSAISDSRISQAINAAGTVYAMILGMCGAASIIFFVSIVSFVKAVTSI